MSVKKILAVMAFAFAMIIAVVPAYASPQLGGTVAVERASIRSGPSALDPALIVVPRWTRLVVERKGTSWHMVRFGEFKGYISASDMRIGGEIAPLIKLYGTAVRPIRFRVKPNGVGAGYSIPMGARLELVHYERGWFRAKHEETVGYVRASDLTGFSLSPPAGHRYTATALKKLILYSGPGERSTALRNIQAGAGLDVLDVSSRFANVAHGEARGFVKLDEIRVFFAPSAGSIDETQLSVDYADHAKGKVVNTSVQNFTYAMMNDAIKKLKRRFPEYLTVTSLGTSTAGRDIPLLLLGNPEAPKRIWVDVSLHAREHMCTQIVMNQIEFLLNNYDFGVFEGKRLRDTLANVCLYIVPMGNPDGVELCQRGLASVKDRAHREYLREINLGSDDFSRWKANIRGVDLVSNFDAKWAEKETVADSPAPYGYKGTHPLSEVESRHCAEFITKVGFDMTISYHAVGGELYWWFGQEDSRQDRDFLIAMDFADLTGYSLISKERSLTDSAGLKDWSIQTFHTPGITVELGPVTSIAPIQIGDFLQIWERNKFVLWHAANLFG